MEEHVMKINNKPKILILIGTYLPGVKGGGPIRTIHNLVSRLNDEFDFFIITSDRDLHDKKPYENITLNEWTKVDNVNIYYLQDKALLLNVINSIDYDLIYINSFFSVHYSIKPIFWRKIKKARNKPIIIAPRGEFSSAALNIKSKKKKLFITLAKCLSLYTKDIVWQGSSDDEKKDITLFLSQNNIPYKEIVVASDLANLKSIHIDKDKPQNNELRICFLSRIVPIKNIKFALNVLKQVDFPIFLGIYGPIEDYEYWNDCLKLISHLPHNINVEYFGIVENKKVQETIARYDLFFVPTKGENYGHVFIEALSSATPILLSDRTPWKNLEKNGIGWDIPLNDMNKFVEVLYQFYHLDQESRFLIKQKCLAFADSVVNNKAVLDANRNMFLDLL
ncbi:glycosyltransferase family 4 protein [Pasteurella sp. PK-2025]|uniref:glycosyltransferase family 4 protein n=1 Tax=Pasteurella sp. PK-2025 TaxID=3413133 RepID=UPI003C7580A5